MKLTKSFNRSLWVFHLNTGSCNGCEIEIVATITPRYDPERFGIKLVGSPKHADVLLVTGPVTKKMAAKVRRVYEQVPDPKLVMCIGTCGQSGGVFYDSYNLDGPIDQVLPVDVYVPGCPPRPEAIVFGVVKALGETGAPGGSTMTETPHLSPQEIIDLYKAEFGAGIHDARITERGEGVRKTKGYNIWIRVDRNLLKPAIKKLMDIRFPHFAVIAGNDLGDEIELLYILSVFYGTKFGEYMITIGIRLPKTDLTVPTITDLIPGALLSEREKQEFFGITVTDIPDGRRLFLPDEFPQGVYPWRKDETGIKPEMVRELWAIGRPKDRPAPPVPEKKPVQEEPAAEGKKEKTGGAPE